MSDTDRTVYIELRGGLVRAVWDAQGRPVPAEVHDYDIEGVDPGILKHDANGDDYIEWGV